MFTSFTPYQFPSFGVGMRPRGIYGLPEQEDPMQGGLQPIIAPASSGDPWMGGAPGSPQLSPDPAPSPVPMPPRLGLMDRLAARMSDLGYGGGEEAKKAALRRALMMGGASLLANAQKQGLGGLPGAVAAGFGGYAEGLQEQHGLRRQEARDALEREQVERQGRYTDALISQQEEGRKAKGEEFRQALNARVELVKQQRQALEKLAPEQRARLEPLLGAEEFNDAYLKVTEPEKAQGPKTEKVGDSLLEFKDGRWQVVYREPADPKPPKEPSVPTTRSFADGSTRQWDPATGRWEILATKAPADRPEKAPEVRVFGDDATRQWDPVRKKWIPAQIDDRTVEQQVADIENVVGAMTPQQNALVHSKLATGMAPREIVAEIRRRRGGK